MDRWEVLSEVASVGERLQQKPHTHFILLSFFRSSQLRLELSPVHTVASWVPGVNFLFLGIPEY